MKLTIEPREWQRQAFANWRDPMRGVVAAVTGAGKTTLALMCVEYFLERHPSGVVLIVVPTLALLDQWYLALIEDLEISRNETGLLAAGLKEWEGRRCVLAVINSARQLAATISEAHPTMLVVDECHRAGSEHNASVLSGRYAATLGLSATPERQYDDGFERLVQPVLGELIFVYDYENAYADGVIVPFELVNVRFPLGQKEQAEYDSLTRRVSALCRLRNEGYEERITTLLRRRARISWNSGFRVPLAVKLAIENRRQRTIVFHESVRNASEIHRLLTARGVRATIYHTALSLERRRENLRLFRSGYYSCMVSCRALDEGLNVPSTSVGIVASGTSSLRQRIQRLGRVLRQVPGKSDALVYTLYATEAEERRLREEASRMEGMSRATWLGAKLGEPGG